MRASSGRRLAVDWIYHLAAISVPGECGEAAPSPLAVAINVDGHAPCWSWPASLRPRPRVLVISSSHVYAPVSPDSTRVAEDCAAGATGAYGVTKLARRTLPGGGRPRVWM